MPIATKRPPEHIDSAAPAAAAPATMLPGQWLDKQDVMQRMRISSRTLQTWRDKKMLPYSKIGGKIYYRESDLHSLLMGHLRQAAPQKP